MSDKFITLDGLDRFKSKHDTEIDAKLATKASTSGNYPNMVAGGAGFLQKANLIEGSLATPRQAAGGEPIGTGKAFVEKIYGNCAEILGAGRGEPTYKSATLKVYGFNLFTCAHLFNGSSGVTITDADDVAEFTDMLKLLKAIGASYYYQNTDDSYFYKTISCYDSSDNVVFSITPAVIFSISDSLDIDSIVKITAPSMIMNYWNMIINISSSDNGKYVPYEEPIEVEIDVTSLTGKLNGVGNSVTIFPDGMFGFWNNALTGNVFYGEYIDGNTAYKCYDTVDLGELEWEAEESTGSTHIFKAPLTTDYTIVPSFVMQGAPQPWFCDNNVYPFSTMNFMMINTSEVMYWDAAYLHVSSLTIDNVSDMVAALDGINLHYLIATKTYTIDNLPVMNYDVVEGSVEDAVPDTGSAPLYASIRYPEYLVTDLEKMSVVLDQSNGYSSIPISDNTYHRYVNRMTWMRPSITLPSIGDTEKVHKIIIAFTPGGDPVTITSADSSTIMYEAGFSLESNKYYEMTCLWDGAKWLLSAKEFVEPSS